MNTHVWVGGGYLLYSHGFLFSAKGFNLIFIYSIRAIPAFLLLHGSGMIHYGPVGTSIPQSRLRAKPIPMGCHLRYFWLWCHGNSQSTPHTKVGVISEMRRLQRRLHYEEI